MGLFDLFKRKQQTTNHNKSTNAYRLELSKTLTLLEEKKYVDDRAAQELIDYALKLTNNNIKDRHFLYGNIIDYYYGLRDSDEEALNKCIRFCEESIDLSYDFLKLDEEEHYHLMKEVGEEREYVPPSIPAFKRLAIIYENEGKYAEAIEVCHTALSLNLRDGTKGGFEGRIKKLEKKAKG